MRFPHIRIFCAAGAVLLRLHAADGSPVRVSTELRLRWDAPHAGIGGWDHFVSSRIRVTATAEPAAWLGFTVQAQDTRAGAVRDRAGAAALANPLDLLLASAELRSRGPNRWTLRAGRQELPLGEERLIASDAEWSHTGRSFDGVRLLHRRGPFEVDGFAATVVRPVPGFDRFDRTRFVSGLQVTWEIREGVLSAAPYHLHTVRTDLGVRTALDTTGVRARARIPLGIEYASEMALQRGRRGGAGTRAWAGCWELARGFGDAEEPTVRIFTGFAYASGGHGRTFDDLFPAGYNDAGVADPFTWRNIASPGIGVKVAVAPRISLLVRNSAYWLADRRGGLFTDQGPAAVALDEPLSARVGDLLCLRATVRLDRGIEAAAGVGRLFAGPYLTSAGMGSTVIPFVQLRFRR